MPLPTVTVDLAELLGEDGEPQTLADRIVEQAARMLVEQFSGETKREIRDQVTLEIKQRAAERIEQVFKTEFFQTDAYGNRRGDKPQTMVEIVTDFAMKHLGEKVNKDGRQDYGELNMTRLAWIAMRAAEETVKNHLEPAIKQAQDKIKAEVGNKLGNAFKAALKDAAASFA